MAKKPPIGITPRWLLDEEREKEIFDAIKRYQDADYSVPIEWIVELNEITKRLSEFYHSYRGYYDGHKMVEYNNGKNLF